MARFKQKEAAQTATKGALANGTSNVLTTNNAERVIEAHYVRPSQLFLRFTDGLKGTWTFTQLCLDMSNMKLTSIKASPSGDCIDVKSKWGDDVQLETSSLRELIDPDYAAAIEKRLNLLARKIGL